VIRAYANRFSEYSGDDVQVKITGDRAESETSHIVSSQVLRPNAPPVHVDWRVHKQGNDYKIVDVDVEGVSMALTQREEFASVIQRNGGTVAGLTQALEQRIASGDTSAAPLPTVR
jgi:phospholipid transport system substrate-binding protein